VVAGIAIVVQAVDERPGTDSSRGYEVVDSGLLQHVGRA